MRDNNVQPEPLTPEQVASWDAYDAKRDSYERVANELRPHNPYNIDEPQWRDTLLSAEGNGCDWLVWFMGREAGNTVGDAVFRTIDRLAQWKASATQSAERWHALGDALMRWAQPKLGAIIPDHLAQAIPAKLEQLEAENKQLREALAQRREYWVGYADAEKELTGPQADKAPLYAAAKQEIRQLQEAVQQNRQYWIGYTDAEAELAGEQPHRAAKYQAADEMLAALRGILEVPEVIKVLANWGDRELIAARSVIAKAEAKP